MRRFATTTLQRCSRRPLHTTSARLGSQDQYSGRPSYETPNKTTDPYKTVSSGYPQNDQGVAFLDQGEVKPEELTAASENPSAEDAAPSPESKMGTGKNEPSQQGLIGG